MSWPCGHAADIVVPDSCESYGGVSGDPVAAHDIVQPEARGAQPHLGRPVDVENGYLVPHPDVLALDNEKIFLKGYMYPTRQTEGIQVFVFCRDSGDCCFGGTPKVEDMIVVRLEGDKTTDFAPGLVSVAGTFKLRRNLDETYGSLTGAEPIYEMSAIQVEPSRTGF